MDITAQKITITIDNSELRNISFYLKQGLIKQVENHYVNHQDVFFKQEERILNYLKQIYNVLDFGYAYDDLIKEIKAIFEKHNNLKTQ